jgi:hypothetical protein
MINRDIEMVFPPRVIPSLKGLRGETWERLVDQVLLEADDGVEKIAFVLLLVRLAGCLSCQADSFRAMRGCSYCSTQTIKRFKGSDQELVKSYEHAKEEVKNYLKKDNKYAK